MQDPIPDPPILFQDLIVLDRFTKSAAAAPPTATDDKPPMQACKGINLEFNFMPQSTQDFAMGVNRNFNLQFGRIIRRLNSQEIASRFHAFDRGRFYSIFCSIVGLFFVRSTTRCFGVNWPKTGAIQNWGRSIWMLDRGRCFLYSIEAGHDLEEGAFTVEQTSIDFFLQTLAQPHANRTALHLQRMTTPESKSVVETAEDLKRLNAFSDFVCLPNKKLKTEEDGTAVDLKKRTHIDDNDGELDEEDGLLLLKENWELLKNDFFMQSPAKLIFCDYHRGLDMVVVEFSNAVFALYLMPDFVCIHLLSISRRKITTAVFNNLGNWLAFGCAKLGKRLVWEWKSGDSKLSSRFSGKRVGITGLGRIGFAIAKRAEAFDWPISYLSRYEKPTSYNYYAVVELASNCDILVVACTSKSSYVG